MIYASNSKPYPNHRNIFLINLLEIREHANMLRIVDMRRMPMKKMKCSNCGRRAFDISKLPKEDVEVTLKCRSAESLFLFHATSSRKLGHHSWHPYCNEGGDSNGKK